MISAFTQNELLLSMMATIAGDDVDLDEAEKAFKATTGDFRTKFTAAVQARMAQLAVPEVFIELPENPDQLSKADLEKLVRPAADGLRSYPTKGELVAEVEGIRRRQERRPAWIPRVDRYDKPIPAQPDSTDAERAPDRALVVAALAELGEVTVRLPEAGEDRLELPMATGGIGEWEAALHVLLGLAGDNPPSSTVALDALANEALVPHEVRWWATEPGQPVPATKDPGVASELLATSRTLGGLPVTDNTSEAGELVADALLCAGDWRYGPRWLLETRGLGDGVPSVAVARAVIAGWADEDRGGLVVYVYGGALHGDDGLISAPVPLHSYLLAVTRSTDGTDTVDALHRITWSCPGEDWCHRGGCSDVDLSEVSALLTPIITAAEAAGTADGDWPATYRLFYGDGDGDEGSDTVLGRLAEVLSAHDWVELLESTWEGGVEELLLRRGPHCLVASYDPVTRQVRLVDGKDELELALDMLADDGVLTDDGLDLDAAASDWDADLLAAADDLLRGRITALPQLASPVQVTVVGLHPHADGTLRGPRAAELAQHQLTALSDTVNLLTTRDGTESARP